MSNWKIAGRPDGIPIVNEVYEIRDIRKGTFVGRILCVREEFADVERIDGNIYWASYTHQMIHGSLPKQVSIRDTLVYLIPQAETELSIGETKQ